MNAMCGHVEDYLRMRRSLGYKLERAGVLLPKLVDYLETAGSPTLTSELAISWARLPVGVSPNHWAARLAVARGFARYLQTIDPATEIPPAGVFPARRNRPTPYLWSQADIARLLDGARALRSPIRAATHQALFGLLAVSGMRVGEATGLDRGDIDFETGVVTIRHAKHDRTRLVPLHETAVAALDAYATERDRLCSATRSDAFFVSSTGTRLTPSGIAKTLRQITTDMGIRDATTAPTAHQLRHSFAVRTLIDWQQSGVSIDGHIAILSTYLGHIAPSDTYWYLSASPELMAMAAERLDTRFGART